MSIYVNIISPRPELLPPLLASWDIVGASSHARLHGTIASRVNYRKHVEPRQEI
jgi:hypothetical protein